MAKPLETVVQRLRRATAADAACDADLLRTFVRSQSEGEKVHMLAEGVMKAMLFNRLRNTAAAVLMACCACVGLTMLAGSPNASGHPQPARKDGAATTVALDRLQGHWKLASVQEDGKPIADVEMLSFFIFGNKLAVKEKKRESVHQFRLDASARPAAIDILHNAGKTYDVGICKLEGDTLFICCHPDQRPTEFATQKGDQVQLLTLRRTSDKVDADLAAMVARMTATDDTVRDIQKAMRLLRQKTNDRDAAIQALEDIERAIQKMRQELRDEEE